MIWTRKRVVSIVEGLGEERAVPSLVEHWIRQHGLFREYTADEPAICAKGVGKIKCAPGTQRGVEYFVTSRPRMPPPCARTHGSATLSGGAMW